MQIADTDHGTAEGPPVCYNENAGAAVDAPYPLSGVATIMISHFCRRILVRNSVRNSPTNSASNAGLRALVALPLLLVAATGAQAQTAPAVPSDAPPKMERLEEGEQPGITIRRPDTERGATETRDPSGTVTETRVQTGVSTYYVRPNTPAGNAQPGDLQSSGNRAAQFKVKEFDLGQRKAPNPAEEPETLEPAPPPPPIPATN